MKVIINLGQGNLYHGCNHILVQLLDSKGNCQRQISGSLPPALELAKLYQQWQFGYSAFYQDRAMRINLLQSKGMRYSEADFKAVCQQIPQQINYWLASSGFAPIEKGLRTDLNKNEIIQIVITSTEPQIQRLPWHLWYLLDDYPQAEITFSLSSWQEIKPYPKNRQKIRILTILGNSTGLNVQEDIKSLAGLPETDLTVLTEPQLSQLNEYLWQEEGWDILLFSGHSYGDPKTGYIYLNGTEKIAISQLKHSLKKAIANGLQIAIFNSCEGTGLAVQLADLSIPYTVVMGEPVPDRIAQVFLKYFLTAFAGGKPFILAVKEAKQKLAGWETEFVCASWLPVIWQNPTVNCLTWQDLLPFKNQKYQPRLTKIALTSSFIVGLAIVLLRSLSWLEPIELWAYDRLLQQRPSETIDPRIVVLEITEEDTNSDRYPISEQTLVEAIDLLNQHQPAAIGLDIHRSYERDTGYRDLLQRFEDNAHIFPVCSYHSSDDSYAPPKGLSEAKLRQQMGFSDLLIDGHKSQVKNLHWNFIAQDLQHLQSPKVRRQLLSYDPSLATSTSKCLTPYSLSFQLAFEFLQQAGIKPLQVNQNQQWQFGDVSFPEISDRFGGYQKFDGKSSQIMINYRSGQPGKRITLAQLRSSTIEPELIENNLILIGYSATVARDYFDTPYGTMPGVWIHGHMTSQILSAVLNERPLIRALPQWGDWLLIIGCSVMMGIVLIVIARKSSIYSLLALSISLVLLDRICLLFLIKGLWLPYIPTVLSLLLVTAIILVSQRNHRLQSRENF